MNLSLSNISFNYSPSDVTETVTMTTTRANVIKTRKTRKVTEDDPMTDVLKRSKVGSMTRESTRVAIAQNPQKNRRGVDLQAAARIEKGNLNQSHSTTIS